MGEEHLEQGAHLGAVDKAAQGRGDGVDLIGIGFHQRCGAFDDAEAAYQAGGLEEAWYLLVMAARTLGYQNGLRSAAFSVSPPLAEQAYKENGAAGGRQKGLNAKLAQARAVERLQDATPEGGWTSLIEIERALAQALRDEALNSNPTQLAKAMKGPVVAAMAKGLR